MADDLPNILKPHPSVLLPELELRTSSYVYKTIEKRLKAIGIELSRYIDFNPAGNSRDRLSYGLDTQNSLVGGIEFRIRDAHPVTREKIGAAELLEKLRKAMDFSRPVFREGELPNRPNLPFDLSMGATKGFGFREIIYLPASGLSLGTIASNHGGQHAPSLNVTVSSAFGKTRPRLEITSLHVSVYGKYCQIHIDQAGFSVGQIPGLSGGDAFLTPDMFQHIWVELFQRDVLGIPEAFEFYVPNSTNDYSKFGIKLEHTFKQDVKVELNISYDVTEGFQGTRGLAGTIGISKSF